MTIDILSDLHLDFYFSIKETIDVSTVKSVFNNILLADGRVKTADMLIIAGDLGHYNEQSLSILKILQAEYYKHIICVLGNHDYYLIDYSLVDKYENNSFTRVQEMRELINSQKDMYCLDGEIIEINGIKFGGCDSSYDNSYLKEYFPLDDDDSIINNMWKNGLNDYRMMGNITSYIEIFNVEIAKLKNIYKKCDVMITHVNPSFLHEHIASAYFGDKFNTFFTFDGHSFMKEGSMKYWVFGHTHDRIEYEYSGVKCICNPFGYPSESMYGDDISIKSITI